MGDAALRPAQHSEHAACPDAVPNGADATATRRTTSPTRRTNTWLPGLSCTCRVVIAAWTYVDVDRPLAVRTSVHRSVVPLESEKQHTVRSEIFGRRCCGLDAEGDFQPACPAFITTGSSCQQQSLATLDCIETELLRPLLPQVRYARLDGRTPAAQRAALALAFNEDISIDVLLLTTSVGGLGLCLTGANIVVMYDHDWNPSRDAQSMDRAHRLGQTRPVCVYRLLIAGSLEERVMGLQRFKARVAAALTDENAGGLLSAVLAELDEQQDNEYDQLLDAVG
ncbi:P-loop containing nucleoside triphosphate hydrolase protein [Pavlovales sp. CCMP2436]|nr:P-loop containing nucleoside triphosphate hydrolase protein [Pavlovales sp. CCMP2436]